MATSAAFEMIPPTRKKSLLPHNTSMEALIPTQRFDGLLVKEMDGRLETFALLRKDVLLLGGAKSPAFLREVLDALSRTSPQVKWIEILDLDHSELFRGQKPGRLDDGALAMGPLQFDTVEPGALGGQPAGNDAHTCFAQLSFLQHCLIVLTQPGFHLLDCHARRHYPRSVQGTKLSSHTDESGF